MTPTYITPVVDDAVTNQQETEKVSAPSHKTTRTTPGNTPNKKTQQCPQSMRSPSAVLALGAVLEHMMTCDCSFRHVKKVLSDESNDSLKIAYQHHNVASTPSTIVSSSTTRRWCHDGEKIMALV
jgi:hypothetical protein